MLLGTPALRDRNDMIKLHLPIGEMLLAVLASVVVSPDDPHLYGEWDIASPTPNLGCFGQCLTRENDRANVTELGTLHFGYFFWDFLRVVRRIKRLDLPFEEILSNAIQLHAIREFSGSKTVLQMLIVSSSGSPS